MDVVIIRIPKMGNSKYFGDVRFFKTRTPIRTTCPIKSPFAINPVANTPVLIPYEKLTIAKNKISQKIHVFLNRNSLVCVSVVFISYMLVGLFL